MNQLQTTNAESSLVPADVSVGAMQSALAGDLSKLTEQDRLKFYGALCEFIGLNPLSRPFEWITFQNKLTLYANKGCAEQLRKIHGVSVKVVERREEFGCYIVRVEATDKSGRTDESLGAVAFKGFVGEGAANAMMKAETKAKRRVTLSICGLGMLDEAEVETITGAKAVKTGLAEIESTEDIAAALNQEQPAKSVMVDAEIVKETPKSEPVKAAGQPVASAPKEEQVVASATAEAAAVLDEAMVMELQTVFGENPECIPYLIANGKLTRPPKLEQLNRKYAEQVLKQSKKFFQYVETWVKNGKKVLVQP